jgi:hypothetical protein
MIKAGWVTLLGDMHVQYGVVVLRAPGAALRPPP